MVMFRSAALDRNRERFNKRRYDVKSRPDDNELAAHIHKYHHDFDKDIDVLILKGNLHQKHEREFWEDKIHLLLEHRKAYPT